MKLKLLLALSFGIMASSSGVLQVQAAIYNFNVDFATKEVANFNDFRQTYSIDTYDLDNTTFFAWSGLYYFDSCPTNFTANMTYRLLYRINGLGNPILLATNTLPDFLCTTTPTSFFSTFSLSLPNVIVEALIDDDADFVQFTSRIEVFANAALNNRTLYLRSYDVYFDIEYDFNTTYLFNYFLSDQQYVNRATVGWTPTFNSTQSDRLIYLYTTAGADTYYIRNSNSSTISTTRKKYAVDYNEEFFRGTSIGAGFESSFDTLADSYLFPSSATATRIDWNYNYYYLNSANVAQAIVDAPTLNFTEEDCGDFLSLNVGCFINNAFAYIVNDAPIISDAFTLLNAGIELGAQTFGIIGNFADDNVFGVMILAGFGFIAVKWFLKND